jgi:hypothetical protein
MQSSVGPRIEARLVLEPCRAGKRNNYADQGIALPTHQIATACPDDTAEVNNEQGQPDQSYQGISHWESAGIHSNDPGFWSVGSALNQ